MRVVKLIIGVLFGIIFLNAGLNKFFHYMPMPELSEVQKQAFGAFMQITWLMPLVATIEIIGGILFMIPRFRALGAIIILPVTVGILLHHTVIDPSGAPMAIVLFLINIWMILDNRNKYKALIA